MRIFVEGLQFDGRHGVYEEERRDGRRFCVDLYVDADVRPTDELDTTLDYRALADAVLEVAHGPSVELIETLASEILDRVLKHHRCVHNATIRIRKKATGVPGDPEWVGVELRRGRD